MQVQYIVQYIRSRLFYIHFSALALPKLYGNWPRTDNLPHKTQQVQNLKKKFPKLPLLSAAGCHTRLDGQHCPLKTFDGVFSKGGETLWGHNTVFFMNLKRLSFLSGTVLSKEDLMIYRGPGFLAIVYFWLIWKGLSCKQSGIVAVFWHRGVVETSGTFTAGVVDTGDKFAIGVIEIFWWLGTRKMWPPVLLIAVLDLDLRISLQIFEKNRNDLKFYNQELGGRGLMKNSRAKNLVPLSP